MSIRVWALILFALATALSGCGKNDENARRYSERATSLRSLLGTDFILAVRECEAYITLWREALLKRLDATKIVANAAAERGQTEMPQFRLLAEQRQKAFERLGAPPERFRSLHEKLVRQHAIISQLQALAQNPVGPPESYGAEVVRLAKEYDQLSAELDVSLPMMRQL